MTVRSYTSATFSRYPTFIFIQITRSIGIRIVRCKRSFKFPVCTLVPACFETLIVHRPATIASCFAITTTNLTTLNVHIRIELYDTVLAATIDRAIDQRIIRGPRGIIANGHIGLGG